MVFHDMAHAPAFQFYGADFLVGTEDFSNEQVGFYLRCLIHQWYHGSVPIEGRKLARIARESRSKTMRIWSEIRSKFRPLNETAVINERLEGVRRKQQSFRELQRRKGRRSAAVKAAKRSTAVDIRLQPKRNSSYFSLQSSSSVQKKSARAARDSSLFTVPSENHDAEEPISVPRPAASAGPAGVHVDREPPSLADLEHLRCIKASLGSTAPALHAARGARRRSRDA